MSRSSRPVSSALCVSELGSTRHSSTLSGIRRAPGMAPSRAITSPSRVSTSVQPLDNAAAASPGERRRRRACASARTASMLRRVALSTRMLQVHDFTPAELRTLRALKTPYGVQRFLDDMPYHLATTAWSPRRVLRERTAHCLAAAIFAAAALRVLGSRPLVLDLEAVHDTDHLLAIFRQRGLWGAVAKSNYALLAWREPIHRTLRELVMSYFYSYFNLRRERTLRTFSRPVNLARFDHLDWMTTDKEVWFIPEYLLTISHTPLLRPSMEKRLTRSEEHTS